MSETVVSLPVIESPAPNHEYTINDIDWQSMQSFITKLEQDYIAEVEQGCIVELDTYMEAAGLDDYELTDDDKEALNLALQNAHLTKQMLRKLIARMGR